MRRAGVLRSPLVLNCDAVSIPPSWRNGSKRSIEPPSRNPGPPGPPGPRVSSRRRWLVWLVQLVVAGVVVAMVWRTFAANWREFTSLHVTLAPKPGWIGLASLVVFATYAIQVESWRRILAGWGQRLAYGRAARIWLLVNLGRYIPGKVWSVAGLIVLAQRAGVEAWAAGASAFAIQAVGIGTAVALVALATPGAASPLRLAVAALIAVGTIGI